MRWLRNVRDHTILKGTFKKETERVLFLESAIPTRMAERFVAPSELAALLRTNILDRGTM